MRTEQGQECPGTALLNPSCTAHSLETLLKISLPLPCPGPNKCGSLGVPGAVLLHWGQQDTSLSASVLFSFMWIFPLICIFTLFLSLMNESKVVLFKMRQGTHSIWHRKTCACFVFCPRVLLHRDSPPKFSPVVGKAGGQHSVSVPPGLGRD